MLIARVLETNEIEPMPVLGTRLPRRLGWKLSVAAGLVLSEKPEVYTK